MKMPLRPLLKLSISLWKAAGAFFSPKGDGSLLFLNDHWKLPSPIPPRVAYFLIVFLLSNFTGEQ